MSNKCVPTGKDWRAKYNRKVKQACTCTLNVFCDAPQNSGLHLYCSTSQLGWQHADGYAKDSMPENTCCSTGTRPHSVTRCPWIFLFICFFFCLRELGCGYRIVSPGLHPISVSVNYVNGYPRLYANTYRSICRWLGDALDWNMLVTVLNPSASQNSCRIKCSLTSARECSICRVGYKWVMASYPTLLFLASVITFLEINLYNLRSQTQGDAYV